MAWTWNLGLYHPQLSVFQPEDDIRLGGLKPCERKITDNSDQSCLGFRETAEMGTIWLRGSIMKLPFCTLAK